MVPQLVGLFEEVATEYDDILPNAVSTNYLFIALNACEMFRCFFVAPNKNVEDARVS